MPKQLPGNLGHGPCHIDPNATRFRGNAYFNKTQLCMYVCIYYLPSIKRVNRINNNIEQNRIKNQ